MYCLIVKRGDPDRFDLLHKTFGEQVAVIWERRRGERRKRTADSDAAERRQRDRRGTIPLTWSVLGFAIARYQN